MSVVQTSALLGLLVLGGCVSTIRSSRPIPDSQTVDRITPLKTHLKDTQVGPAAPRLLVDLAEAYLEQARVLTLESIESGTEVDEFQLRYLAEQAAATYTVLAATYPKWPPRPRALLTLGNLLNQLEDTEEANQWFDRLVERYPNSTQAAQVLLRRGRDKVHSGDNSQAIALLSALSGRDDALGARAHYWLAWAYRNQGKEVVAFEHYAIAAKRASALKLDIHREAIQDSIVVFDTVHPRDPGVETYRDLAHDRGVYLEALERIQRRAQGLDEAEHALAVGREVLRLSNDVERVEDRAIGLYRAHIDSETRHLIAADIALLGRAQRLLTVHGSSSRSQETDLAELAFDLWMRFQRRQEGTKGSPEELITGWRTFVLHWPNHPSAKDARVNLSRALDRSGHHLASADTWSKLATMDAQPDGLEPNKEAVARYLRAFEGTSGNQDTRGWRSLAGMQRHLKPAISNASPHTASAMVYQVARAHQQAGADELASALYQTIVDTYPFEHPVLASAQALLSMANSRRDIDELRRIATFLERSEAAHHPEIEAEIARLKPMIDAQKKASSLALARQQSTRDLRQQVQRASGEEEEAVLRLALVNRARREGNHALAMQSYQDLQQANPTDEHLGLLASQLANDAIRRGQFDEAVSLYLDTLRAQPERVKTVGPLAARLLEQIGDSEGAVRVWRAVAKQEPNHPQAAEALAWLEQDLVGPRAGVEAAAAFLESGGDSARLRVRYQRTVATTALARFYDVPTRGDLESFQAKAAHYGQVQAALSALVQSGRVAMGITALSELSDATFALSASLDEIEPPPGLSMEDSAVFVGELKAKIKALESQAEAFRSQCAQSATQYEVPTPEALSCIHIHGKVRAPRVSLKHSGSARLARKRLRQRPGEPNALVHLAAILASNGHLGQARTLAEFVIQDHPGHAEALYLLGRVLWHQGEIEQGVAHIRMAAAGGHAGAQSVYQQVQAALSPAAQATAQLDDTDRGRPLSFVE